MFQIENLPEFEQMLVKSRRWKNIAIQGLDLSAYTQQILDTSFDDCIFLGCARREARGGTGRSGSD